ncbi:tRNA splicing endonuclease subunit sen2 [Pleodorina starrii]|uniref:tRNA splicing endonuclease subunit sen2 n=1 Tax=Pleodorina starrii TaxID=330485 RepID=A0A9W6B973_9CHLO|nr:tRNA splicing endonuclease subunit sen2 [Pleodorina starrii]GLC47573.1 tRNA splicing endonuclease subunit sen2 [Pleodorina starrii]GLC76858.1 tRNA splicing endonuclease subunit sen2 [Pleodorina starrii]
MRVKRTQAAPSQQPNKRHKTCPQEEGAPSSEVDMLQMLPQEMLHLVIGNLTPRECQPLRLTCKALRDVVNAQVADTLTVTNDMAQYLVLEQVKHSRSGAHNLSNGWVARLLAKFPKIKNLDVKCSQNVLTLFSRHMVRDCLGSVPPGSVPLARIFDLADHVKTNSRRHSAVLICELIKFKVAQSLTSKPPGYEAMRQDIKQYGRADQLLTEHRIELQARVIELVEKVLTLKGHVDARAHEHYKYARDTLDDSLLQLVSCLQPRHSKYAYQLLAKAADPAKAARGWRWLFYFLARQKQAEAAIEAYKVVDKQALAQLSPTCLSELFRSLIDNEITTQPEPKLRAITSDSGSWTKFLYRGNFTLTSTQSREGALEKVAADLIGKDYLDTAVNVMNRFETESTAMEIWTQLLGALGIVPGGEMPLVTRDLHRVVSDQVHKASLLAMQAQPARRVACHIPLVEVLVAEGHLEDAYNLVASYPEQGALDKHLLRALNVFSLADCPPAQLSSATCTLLLDVLQHRLRDVAARSELTTILVAAYAARKDLDMAVRLASGLDAAAAAAMEADAGAAGGPAVEPVPAAAAQGAAGLGAGGVAGVDGGALAGADGDGAGPGAVAGQAGQRLAEMWRGVAVAAIRQGDAGVLLTALPRVNTSWLLGAMDEDLGSDAAASTSHAGPSSSRPWLAEAGPGSGPMAAVGGADAVADGAGDAVGSATAAGNSNSGGMGASSGPSTVWQSICGVLLRSGRRADLESALLQLLGERRRFLGGHTDQRALLESTARAMILNGCPAEALALARRLGGGYLSQPEDGCGASGSGPSAVPWPSTVPADVEGAAATSAGVRPCWSMLNVILEGYMSTGQLQLVLQELFAAGSAQSKAAATSSGGVGGAAVATGNIAAGLVVPLAAGRLRQSLLADVLASLTEAGRLNEAVHLLRVLRGGESDGPLLPTQTVPLPTTVQRAGSGTGRVTRSNRAAAAAAKRNRGNSASATAADQGMDGAAGAATAAVAAAAVEPVALADSQPEAGAAPPGVGTSNHGGSLGEANQCPQPQYSRLLLEGSGDEEAGQAAGAGLAASAVTAARASASTLPGPCTRAASLEAALAGLVKALLKRASGSGSSVAGGSGAASGSSDDGSGMDGGGGGSGGMASSGGDLLGDWLEVCKAWPLGPNRDSQLDSLARRAMDKGRDLEVALQAGWLLGETSQQEQRFAYTHRDLAQKCMGQGMLEAAQACLLRVHPHNRDSVDATARELMRWLARAGEKPAAIQLATIWAATDEQRAEMTKSIHAIRATASRGAAGGAAGSRAGSSSRGSSRDCPRE